jgi:hypothetical protein
MQPVPFALVLAVVQCSLLPLAHATPPDETWRPGIYDDADSDDVVVLATNEIGAGTGPVPALLLVPVIAATLHAEAVGVLTAPPVRCASSRAPPAPRAFI